MATEKQERSIPHVKVGTQFKLYKLYEFGEELGHGNFGIVHSAIEKKTDKKVAIKIMHKSNVEQLIKTYLREIHILKIVDHPNIVHLEKIYESPSKIYLIFTRLWGSLLAYYKIMNPLTEKRAKTIIEQLFSAVAYLSKRGIIHRDVKLENILLVHDPFVESNDLTIKLTDFGLSVIKVGSGLDNMLQDKSGTLAYMAPEMFTKQKFGELCDVWAAGIIFYTLLYGHHPFCSLRMPERDIIDGICNKALRFDEECVVSNDAKDFLKVILEKNPLQRFTALEVQEHRYLSGNSTNRQDILTKMSFFKQTMNSDWESESVSSSAEMYPNL